MGDQLDFDKALSFARQLKSIPNFPWDEDVIVAHAHHLVRWCEGAFLDGRIWPAERQAQWLVTEAQENWEKWLGPFPLLQMFRAKFKLQHRPELKEVNLGPKPPVECSVCNDSGLVATPGGTGYCECLQGQRMATDPALGERWLDLINGKSFNRKKDRPAMEIDEAAFEAYRASILAQISEAEAVLADPGAKSEAKEIARETIRVYRAEQPAEKKKASRR